MKRKNIQNVIFRIDSLVLYGSDEMQKLSATMTINHSLPSLEKWLFSISFLRCKPNAVYHCLFKNAPQARWNNNTLIWHSVTIILFQSTSTSSLFDHHVGNFSSKHWLDRKVLSERQKRISCMAGALYWLDVIERK